jgi:CrcB protein
VSVPDPDLPPAPVPLLPLLLAVAVGGAIGSLGRYGVGELLPPGRSSLPVSTLLVNVAGSLALGLLVGALPRARWLRPFVGTGVLGGFTTFSAFALETDRLLGRAPVLAVVYVGLTLLLGLAAAWLGLLTGRRVA